MKTLKKRKTGNVKKAFTLLKSKELMQIRGGDGTDRDKIIE